MIAQNIIYNHFLGGPLLIVATPYNRNSHNASEEGFKTLNISQNPQSLFVELINQRPNIAFFGTLDGAFLAKVAFEATLPLVTF